MEIIPAIMPENFHHLRADVGIVADHVSVIQLDIMDGKFVPAKTWPYLRKVEEGAPTDVYFQAIQNGDEGLPLWEKVDFELDLMIERPEENIDQWVALGPTRIVLHIESILHPEKALEHLQPLREFIELGLSFDDDYEVTKLDHYIELVDFVQVMGIDEIGKQGEPFEPRSLYNIAYLRNKFPGMPISVDGAVNRETIQKFKEAGATRFVAGSAIFQGEAKDNIKYLQSLLQE